MKHKKERVFSRQVITYHLHWKRTYKYRSKTKPGNWITNSLSLLILVAEGGPALWMSLAGKAKEVIKDMALEEIKADNGLS